MTGTLAAGWFSAGRCVGREAVQQARATAAHQLGLAATPAGVGGVPGDVVAAGAVEVPDLGRAVLGVARPVPAGLVGRVGEGAAIGRGARPDVVLLGLV